MLSRRSNEAGDTIIEVLIALTIIGLVLAGAYATANTSSRVVRQSQERSAAVKVAETQLETIRSINADIHASSDREAIYNNDDFCFSTNDDIYQYSPGYSLPEYNDIEGSVSDDMPTECNWNSHYYAHITYSQVGGNSRFIITVRWDRLGGGVDEVVIPYGIYEAPE